MDNDNSTDNGGIVNMNLAGEALKRRDIQQEWESLLRREGVTMSSPTRESKKAKTDGKELVVRGGPDIGSVISAAIDAAQDLRDLSRFKSHVVWIEAHPTLPKRVCSGRPNMGTPPTMSDSDSEEEEPSTAPKVPEAKPRTKEEIDAAIRKQLEDIFKAVQAVNDATMAPSRNIPAKTQAPEQKRVASGSRRIDT